MVTHTTLLTAHISNQPIYTKELVKLFVLIPAGVFVIMFSQ